MSKKIPVGPNGLTALNFRQLLTIRHLRLVSTLGRELNMSHCAKILHTSQSAISRGVGEIESLVGVRLFDRTTRRVRPTSFGKVLIWHADQIVGQLGRAEAEFRALGEGHIGLDVGVMGGFSPTRIAQAVRLTTNREPALRVRLHSNFADGLIPDLLNGRFNLALTHLDTRDFGNEELTARPLYEDEIGVLAGLDHPLVRRERVYWADLASESWVLTPVETSTRRIVERNLLPHPAASRRVIVETMETHYMISLVRDGAMLTALPMSLARYFAEDLGIARLLPMVDGASTWTAYVAHRKSQHLSAAEELFIQCLKGSGPD